MKNPSSLIAPGTKSAAIQLVRSRVTAAEASVENAKQEARAAKQKREEAKKAARRAKKRLRRAKDELAEAQLALAEADKAYARKPGRPRVARKKRMAEPRVAMLTPISPISSEGPPESANNDSGAEAPSITPTAPVYSIAPASTTQR